MWPLELFSLSKLISGQHNNNKVGLGSGINGKLHYYRIALPNTLMNFIIFPFSDFSMLPNLFVP